MLILFFTGHFPSAVCFFFVFRHLDSSHSFPSATCCRVHVTATISLHATMFPLSSALGILPLRTGIAISSGCKGRLLRIGISYFTHPHLFRFESPDASYLSSNPHRAGRLSSPSSAVCMYVRICVCAREREGPALLSSPLVLQLNYFSSRSIMLKQFPSIVYCFLFAGNFLQATSCCGPFLCAMFVI